MSELKKQKDVKRKSKVWIGGCCILFLSISFASTFIALAMKYLKCDLDFLIWTAIICTGSTLLGLVFLNVWVTRIANLVQEAYSKIVDKNPKKENDGNTEVNQNTEISGQEGSDNQETAKEVDFQYQIGCSYCGEEGKRLICGSCDSILWYKIDTWKNKIGFFAAHRRNLVNGIIISAFLVTPLTFLYQLIDKKVEAYKIYEEKSFEAREALNRSRELIIKLENLDQAYLQDTENLLKQRLEIVDEYHKYYMKASWLAPQVFAYFGWEYEYGNPLKNCLCSQSPKKTKTVNANLASLPFLGVLFWKKKADSCKTKTDTSSNKYEFNLKKYWKILNKEWKIDSFKTNTVDFFKTLDEDYKNYIIISDSFYRYAYLEPDPEKINELANRRCQAAQIFYKKGQLLGCLLFHVSFDNYRTDESSNKVLKTFGCATYFEKYRDYWCSDTLSYQKLNESISSDTVGTSFFSCFYAIQKPQADKVAIPEKKPKKTPVKTPACVIYDVMAETFSYEESAERRVRELKKLGCHQAYYYHRTMEGFDRYRVVAYSTTNKLEADNTKITLKKEHGIGSWVEKRDNQIKSKSKTLVVGL